MFIFDINTFSSILCLYLAKFVRLGLNVESESRIHIINQMDYVVKHLCTFAEHEVHPYREDCIALRFATDYPCQFVIFH